MKRIQVLSMRLIFGAILISSMAWMPASCSAFQETSAAVSSSVNETHDLADAAEKNEVLTRLIAKSQSSADDVNQAQPDGMTALHWAAFHRNEESVAELLKADAEVDAKTHYSITPLTIACRAGDAGIVERLLEAGADANQKQKGGETPLMTTARTGSVEVAKLLLAAGAKVDAQEHRKQTALMLSLIHI